MNQRHPRPDIQRLLERRARHGLTYRELAEESGIPIPTLEYWAAKQRREERSSPPARFEAVEVLDDADSGAIVIELGSSVRVKVERDFDDTHLARVLAVLSRC